MMAILAWLPLLLMSHAHPAQAEEVEETVRVHCTTTKGEIDIDVHPEWAPLGAKRYLDLVRMEHFNNIGLGRVNGDIVQFGEDWQDRDTPSVVIRHQNIQDDPKPPDQRANKNMLKRGQLSYAGGGPNTRSASIFFVVKPNMWLGREPWEVPFAEVVGDGMERVVDQFYGGYGDFPFFKCSTCHGPDVQKYWLEGNSYLEREFPLLDMMEECHIVEKPKGPQFTSTHNAQGLPHPPSSHSSAYNEQGDSGSALACFLIGIAFGVFWLRIVRS
mmetsp:Transcript_42511/g.69074  ORF Transcript_42511/g.69074 Transcript_42511/m.69074 type:complete len:272 (-) Transcript_42511:137-952(-)